MLASKEDLLFVALDSAERTCDNTVVVYLKADAVISVDALANDIEEATRRAITAAPRLGMRLQGKYWVRVPHNEIAIEIIQVEHLKAGIEQWINQPFDTSDFFWCQRIYNEYSTGRLAHVFRIHHALLDGLSSKWLVETILLDAFKLSNPVAKYNQPLHVDTFNGKKQKNPFTLPEHVPPLTKNGLISGAKRFVSISIPLGDLAPQLASSAPASLYELLIASVIQGIKNSGVAPQGAYGVSLPISIRKKGTFGWGNGASKIMLYDLPGATLMELARHIHTQIRWNRLHGAWHFPNLPMRFIPLFLFKWMIRLSMQVKNVDRGSLIVTGIEASDWEHRMPFLEDIQVLVALTHNHSLILCPIFLADRISLVATYNDGCFSEAEILHLLSCVRISCVQSC